ncbi:transmembrane protein, putative (macronuclear) [Tetrahymena thermophila SB210]|uniref:Transmembrane protein, putative n=1 Tax=Tetrahymena thermophila (strain SB210) TaxID=312017 RepID=I7MB19_TETTS|nr:transmembrane protein, putative [Tetrahymena thermophila SB210]EAS07146.2 transmembrane protein, putative [Tetrahymena thermophila SB210]|eukprot:XP_001027388.2 transmembrane protein, putative [Tetrahymena thermophila SB210]
MLNKNYNKYYKKVTRFYNNYIISSYLKIPKTNILLINTILTDQQGYQIGSFVYYNDISKNQDNIVNAIKPDFTIRQMKFIERTNKILAISYYSVIIADPYSLQAEQKLVFEMIQSVDLIKDSNYAIISSITCQSYIIDTVNLQQVVSFDVCQYGTDAFSNNIFSKAFKLQNGLSFIAILDNQQGIQTWTFNSTSTSIQFNGYLPQPASNGVYFDIDIHDKYGILFTIGSNYQITTFQIQNQNNYFNYQQLSSINLVNTNNQNLTNVKYVIQETPLGYQQSLYLSDINTIYRLDFQFNLDPTNQIVQQIVFTNQNKPVQSNPTAFTCSYDYVQDTFQSRQYYLNTAFTKLYEVDYNQVKYFVTAQSTSLYVAKDSLSGSFVETDQLQYYVKQYPNSFIKVQNCPLCFITLIQNYWANLWYFYNLNLDQVNQNIDAYYDGQNSIWVLIGLPFKYNNENYLFGILDPCNLLFKTLSSDNQDDNINKTCYALYSHPNQLIIGLDIYGNVYAWNSQKIDQFMFKKTITGYSCLNSGIGQLYNYGANIYLIAVCEDYQVISYNIMTENTQILVKLNSKPNHINSFEESNLLGIGDRDTSEIYLYQFNQQTGLFTIFMNFLNNQNKDKSINLTFYPDTQLLWIQYQYSNIYIPIGNCLQNVNNCLNCSMDFYFKTNEVQLSDQSYGLGTIDSPFTTSKGLIQAFLQMQYYSQLIFGIKSIQANFYIDPSNKITIYQELLGISNAKMINLRMVSTNPLALAQILVQNILIFSNFLQINLENILVIYNFSNNQTQQCGMQFESIIQQVTINNVNHQSSNSSIKCYSILVNNSTVVLSNIIIQNEDFSNFEKMIQIQNSQQITLNNIQIIKSILNSQFSILSQQNDVKVIINKVLVQDNICNTDDTSQNQQIGQLFQASQYQVDDMQILSNKFCNLRIFSTISNINQLNYVFSFNNIIIQKNQFLTISSYLFFNAIYYFNLLPMHTLILTNIYCSDNHYVPKQTNQANINISITQFFQINKLKNITISNITFMNHYEIAFSTISQSQQAILYNISCLNDLSYQQSISANFPYAGCTSFNDINILQLNVFNSSFIRGVDNSILEIINQSYENNLINLTNISVQNSQFYQKQVNSYSNPIFISSEYYSNISISLSHFNNNTLNGLLNSQTYSTTGIQIINSLGDIYLNNNTFSNSKSNSFYNYLYFQIKNAFINNINFSQSSFDFSDNPTLFTQEGGCIRIKSNYLQIKNSQFSQSTSKIGSFIYIEPLSQQLQIIIQHSSFSQGYSSNDGAAIYINSQNTQFDLQIQYTNFTDIYALSENSNAISVLQNSPQTQSNILNKITFTQLYVQNLMGLINSSFLKVINSLITIQGMIATKLSIQKLPDLLSVYQDKISQLTILDFQNTNITLLDCEYFSLQSLASSSFPLLIKSINSQIQIINTNTYSSNFSQSLIDLNQGQLTIIKSKFYNLTQVLPKSRVIQQSSNNQLNNQFNSLIKLTNGNLKVLDNSVFNNINCQTNCYGSSILLNYSSFQIYDSYFMNSLALNGGAISLFGLNSTNNIINNTNFINNQATNNGGALYLQLFEKDVFQINMNRSQFIENKGLQGYGGAFYITSQSANSQSQQIILQDCQILQNRAKVGGGIYNQGINPVVDSKSLVEHNLAIQYGDDKFSYPSYLELINQSSFKNEINMQTIILYQFKSGGSLPEFVFQLRDSSNKPVTQIDGQSYQANIQISNRTSQKDKYYFRGNSQIAMDVKQNIFKFDQIDFIGIPGSQSYIEFTSDTIRNYNNYTHQYDSNYSFIVQVNFRNCQYGEYINQYNNYQECQTCEDGKYTLDYTACYDCPIGGTCKEGIIELKEGYWRDQQYSDNIVFCTNRPQNCIGNTYGNKVCINGNIGPLCEECDIYGEYWQDSYTRKNKYECIKCKEIKDDSWKLILSVFWILFSVLLTVKSDKKNQQSRILQYAFFKNIQTNAKSTKQQIYQYQQQSKVYIKILTNYIQIISSVFAFNLNFDQQILQITHYLGAPVSTSVDYFDCILKDSTLNIPLIYQKLIILIICPFLVMIIYLAYEAVHQKLINKSKKFYHYSLYCAFIFLFIYLQPDLVYQMISLLSCRQVGQNQYILANMNHQCFTETYNFYSQILVIPSLIVWVIIFPMILFIQIYISKKKFSLNNIQVNLKYGFLYQEYKESAYYWEFVKIIQKTVIIIVLNFYSQALIVKGSLVYIVILFYQLLATKVKPYQIDQLNKIDIYSTKVCGLSILFCIFISNNQYYYFQVCYFIIIIALNLLFILNIGIKIIKHKQNQIIQFFQRASLKCPQIQRCLRFNLQKKQINPQLKQKLKKQFTHFLNLNLSQRKDLLQSLKISRGNYYFKQFIFLTILQINNQLAQLNSEVIEKNKNFFLAGSPQYEFSPNLYNLKEESDIVQSNALSSIGQVQSIIAIENNNQNEINKKINNYFKKKCKHYFLIFYHINNQIQNKEQNIDLKEIQLSEFNKTQKTQTNQQNPFILDNKLSQLQADNDDIMFISQMEQVSQFHQNQKKQNY